MYLHGKLMSSILLKKKLLKLFKNIVHIKLFLVATAKVSIRKNRNTAHTLPDENSTVLIL